MRIFINGWLIWGLCCLGCQPRTTKQFDEVFVKSFQEQLILADSGTTIHIPEGAFSFDRSVSLDGISHITIKGAGKEKSILNFLGQKDGAEGMLIKANHVTLEGFSIEDSKGDAIKIQDSKNVVLRDIKTTWTQGAKSTNGGYGIYPVACTDVLIENCEASYASDAGVYIGQSNRVVMRNNKAHHNVAGIEVENSRDVLVYDNVAENNTGGILVFDMPGLPQANGRNVKVYNNLCIGNNHENFAPEGGVVAILPPGTGILILAHSDVEVFHNKIHDHKTLGLGIISWFFTERPFDTSNGFDPYSRNVFVYENDFVRKRTIPDLTKEFGQMLNALFVGKPQDIIIDGIFAPNEGVKKTICFSGNGNELRFANLNANNATGISDLRKSLDHNLEAVNCKLPGFQVAAPEGILLN